MKFWLFFIQSLPTIPFSELDNQEVEINPRNSINSQDNQVNQMIQEIPTHPQMSQVNIGEMSGLIGISLIAGTILLLFIIAVWLYTRFYVITPNNEAFVRTGGVFQKSNL